MEWDKRDVEERPGGVLRWGWLAGSARPDEWRVCSHPTPEHAILQVTMSTTCGSDLHFIDGYIPTMRQGDVIGHEFMGEVVEVGSEVQKVKKGDRVVVPSVIGCGTCWYCQHELYSLCDNTNPN